MADVEDEKEIPDGPDVDPEKKGENEGDLDDEMAAALEKSSLEDEDVDQLLAEVDPSFGSDLEDISSKDFSGIVIEKENVSKEVDEEEEVPSAFRAFWNNMPKDIKTRYFLATAVVAILTPFAILVYMGKILPSFDLPYFISMQELSKKTYAYPVDDPEVPLFDEFRNKSHTVQLPKATINLKTVSGQPSYGSFQFSFVLRDKDAAPSFESKQSEIMDLMMRVLEQVTWKELQSPIGKEKVKKVIRHRVNEYLQGNVVIGVYYQSVILQK